LKPFNPSVRSRDDKAADEKERNEAERFAVAAIAFALKHDSSFRRQFWERVCWVKGDPPLCKSPEILLEPAHWADLLIINLTKAGRYAYVIECKIRAGLGDAQNPAKRAFGGQSGYGSLFCNDERTARCRLRFCVLGRSDLDLRRPLWHLPVKVQQKEWQQIRDDSQLTPLTEDLFQTLGMLGVQAFPAVGFKPMKVNLNLVSSQTEKLVKVLCEVRRRIGWEEGTTSPPWLGIGEGEDGRWWIGVSIKKARHPASKELTQIVMPPERMLAEFGYHQTDERHRAAQLEVWLYCGNKRRQTIVAARLRTRVAGAHVKQERDGNWFNVIVSTREHKFAGDSDWFVKVFDAIGLTTLA